MQDCRAILFHKQATSARTRFLCFDYGVCAFDGLPPLAQVLSGWPDPVPHPAPVLRTVGAALGLAPEILHAEEGFRYQVDVPGARIPVLLVGIDTIDPPQETAAARGGRFIDLTQARGLPPAELELLRGAYEVVLG